MKKAESIIVGLILGTACLLLMFVIFWWTAAVFYMLLPGVPVKAVITSSLIGLASGVVLDIVYLKRWIRAFYTANIWILAAIYLGLCASAVALFMGLPVGTFFLGIGSGVYIGRRQRHTPIINSSATRSLHLSAIFAAVVTTAAALPMGILALNDRIGLRLLEALLGIGQAVLHGIVGLTAVGVLCCILFVAQYWCARIAGQLSFTIGKQNAQPEAARNGI